jgi:uncharacterized membrane protein YbhN (UPF0104 family)
MDPTTADQPADPPVADPASAGRRSRLKLAIRIVGALVAVVAIGLCVKTVADQWSDISHAIRHASPGMLVLALVLSGLSMTGLGVLWWRTLAVFGEHRPAGRVIAWYFAGELGKYLPGGVWQVVGRGELAVRGGARRQVAYSTTLLAMGLMCIGAAVVCAVFTPFLAADGGSLGWVLLLLALIPVGAAAVHPRILGPALGVVARLRKGSTPLQPPNWGRMLELVLWSCPTWLLVGFASVAATDALGYHQHPARVAFAAVAAWIVGFLCVPVPAGAGIRELVFVAVCGLDAAPATAVAAIARIALVITDGVGGVIGLWVVRRTRTARLGSATTDATPRPSARHAR